MCWQNIYMLCIATRCVVAIYKKRGYWMQEHNNKKAGGNVM